MRSQDAWIKRAARIMDLSYAQRLEDYHLACAFGDQSTGFYVDVGGGHPVADNVSYWFYLRGWRGLVIEPQPRLFDRYRFLRPRDIAVQSLVGRSIGEVDFHVFDTFHGLSTTVEHHARRAAEIGAAYKTTRQPVTTLSSLLEAHSVERIDFLKVDVEGAEGEVFAGLDWSRWRPRIIVAEAVVPNDVHQAAIEWEDVLLGHDYRFALFDGLNRFYVAAEEHDLLKRLPQAPADWGIVHHLYEFGRAPETPAHPDHALARRLIAAFLASLPLQDETSLAALLGELEQPQAEESFRALLPDGMLAGGGTREDFCRAVVRTEAFRSAIGRIAAPYDGGLPLDDEPTQVT
jgi:FkbM family methyltransferase